MTSDTPMDERLAQLEDTWKRRICEVNFPFPKIQRVPIFLRENAELAKYYSPKMISFGPIHHGSKNLEQGERYKLLWTSKFVEKYSIAEYRANIQELRMLLTHQDTFEVKGNLDLMIVEIIEDLRKLLTHQDTTEREETLREEIVESIDELEELLKDQDTNSCKEFLLENIVELKQLLTHQQHNNNEGDKFFHKRIEENIEILHLKIVNKIEDLKKLFTEDAIGSYNDNDLAWMLFVDGCSLLYFMENVNDERPEALMLKLDQLMHMYRDITLLENQIPMRVLELLRERWVDNLEVLMNNYHSMGSYKQEISSLLIAISPEIFKPIHILDRVRSLYTKDPISWIANTGNIIESQRNGDQMDFPKQLDVWQTYKNIRDLKTAGIRVKAYRMIKAPEYTSTLSKILGVPTDVLESTWSNISYTTKWFGGELRLPRFKFNDDTPYLFHNMIAYEMCSDFNTQYECCSFFSFMDSLIDTAEDVKELRSAGVIQNLFGSDEELAKFFNELGNGLPTKMYSNFLSNKSLPYSMKYIQVRHQIQEHYRNKWKRWLAQGYNTHFNTPWTMIAFLAAFLALLLTFVQTWYAILPKNP